MNTANGIAIGYLLSNRNHSNSSLDEKFLFAMLIVFNIIGLIALVLALIKKAKAKDEEKSFNDITMDYPLLFLGIWMAAIIDFIALFIWTAYLISLIL